MSLDISAAASSYLCSHNKSYSSLMEAEVQSPYSMSWPRVKPSKVQMQEAESVGVEWKSLVNLFSAKYARCPLRIKITLAVNRTAIIPSYLISPVIYLLTSHFSSLHPMIRHRLSSERNLDRLRHARHPRRIQHEHVPRPRQRNSSIIRHSKRIRSPARTAGCQHNPSLIGIDRMRRRGQSDQ